MSTSLTEIEDTNQTVEETYSSEYEPLEEMNRARHMTVKYNSEDTVGMHGESADEYVDNNKREITTEDSEISELGEEEPERPEYESNIEVAMMEESSQSNIVHDAIKNPLTAMESSSSKSVVSFVVLIATLNMFI